MFLRLPFLKFEIFSIFSNRNSERVTCDILKIQMCGNLKLWNLELRNLRLHKLEITIPVWNCSFLALGAVVSEQLQAFFLTCVRACENRPANRTTLGAFWERPGSALRAVRELSGSLLGAPPDSPRAPPMTSTISPQKTASQNDALLFSFAARTRFSNGVLNWFWST